MTRENATVMNARAVRKCPETCRYRNKLAAFCGYCMIGILESEKEDNNGSEQNETEDFEQAVREGL